MASLSVNGFNSLLKSSYIFSASSTYISQMVDTSRSTISRVTPIILIFYVYNSVILVRLMAVAVLLNGHYSSSQSYFAIDLFLGYLNQLGFLDGYLALVFWPTCPFVLFLSYTVDISCGRHCYQLAYELMVLNKTNFFVLNPQLNWQRIASQLGTLWRRSEQLVKVTSQPLAHFPSLQTSIRQKALVLSVALDLLNTVFLHEHALTISLSLLYFYLKTIWPVYSLGSGLVIAFEGAIMAYCAWLSARIGVFLGHFNNLIIFVESSQLNMAMEKVKLKIMLLIKSEDLHSPKYLAAQGRLAYFLSGVYLPLYNRVLNDLDKMNTELISDYLLFTLSTMFGFNIYCLSMLSLEELSTKVKVMLILFCLFETFFLFITIKPMLAIVPVVRSSRGYLYRANTHLANSHANVRLKLKLAANYDLPTFAFTAGMFGDVTNNGLLQFFLIYTSYFMFSLGLVQGT